MLSSKKWLCTSSFVIGCLLWSSAVYADWDIIGAAAKCVKDESLTVVAVEWSSSDSPEYNPVPKGFKKLEGKTALSCKVGSAMTKALINVFPPAARGQGMGCGYVSIDSIEVNGVPIFGHPTAFNWEIPGSDKSLVKIAVFLKDDSPTVEVCNTEKCYQESLVHDRFLNSSYQELITTLPESGRELLCQEQRFWLKERDPQCRYAVIGAKNEPLAFLKCVMSATRIRTLRLMDLKLEHQLSKKPNKNS